MFGAKSVQIAAAALAAMAFVAVGAPTAHAQVDPTRGHSSQPSEEEAAKRLPDFNTKKRNPAPCPLLGVLYDAARLVELKAPEERYASVGFTGEINGVRGLCEYSAAKPIEMNLTINLAFGRGPMAAGDTHVYRYWVAVTRTNVGPIAKQYFDVPVRFANGAQRVFLTENIKKIEIPRANAKIAGTAFEILVGFDLTPEELAFNRAGKRFKMVPTGKSG